MKVPKQYLQWYRLIEKELRSFFALFGDLCASCFAQSVAEIEAGTRPDDQKFCCCLVDNQLHSYWSLLQVAQEAMNGSRWQVVLEGARVEITRRRLPNNGPCPALSGRGCVLNSMRPPTCSTQLCRAMAVALNRLVVHGPEKTGPVQIEEILGQPSIMDVLYGVRRGVVVRADVDRFVLGIRELKAKLQAVSEAERLAVIADEKEALLRRMRGKVRA
jgi:hypothetical protein